MPEEELQSHADILRRYLAMHDGVEKLWNKINDLRSELSEHEQVLKALEPMEASRRCYRLVGDVLVERTVGEVIPDVKQNEQGLQEILKTLTGQLDRDCKALADFQKKYKIREKGEKGSEEEGKEGKADDGHPGTSQGVLVSSS